MDDYLKSLAERVDPKHTAVLVVDVQNDFCAEGGFFDKFGIDIKPAHGIVSNLKRLIKVARTAGALVVFVQAILDMKYMCEAEAERRNRLGNTSPRAADGSWGADFYGVRPESDDIIVRKHRYSAFIGTDLEQVLEAHRIRTVVTTGVATNVCVDSTSRDAFMKNYYVVFLNDCTAGTSEELHRATLENIGVYFGIVTDSNEVIKVWE